MVILTLIMREALDREERRERRMLRVQRELLAALSSGTDLSVGCYCADESRCHRSLLRKLLVENGAAMA